MLWFGMAMPNKVCVGLSVIGWHEARLELASCYSTKLVWCLTDIGVGIGPTRAGMKMDDSTH